MAGGRQRFIVRQYFDAVDGTKDVTCEKCNQLIPNAKVEKLDRHILNYCGQWSQNGKKAFTKAAAHERQPARCRTSVEEGTSISGENREIVTSSSSMTQDAFNKLVANYVYSSGARFRTVERPDFVAAMLEGRPGLAMPSGFWPPSG
ncbi:hypothetical protein ON010_g9428 [Phytophthora cinnamomi]|nr:hypothetical protein ON010_g9428 [Phytophthora cinnamomi]